MTWLMAAILSCFSMIAFSTLAMVTTQIRISQRATLAAMGASTLTMLSAIMYAFTMVNP